MITNELILLMCNVLTALIALKYRAMWKREFTKRREEHAAIIESRNNEFKAACKIRQLERQITALGRKR